MKYSITNYTEEQIKEKFGVNKETFEKIREDIELKCDFKKMYLEKLEIKYLRLKIGMGIFGALSIMIGFYSMLYFEGVL